MRQAHVQVAARPTIALLVRSVRTGTLGQAIGRQVVLRIPRDIDLDQIPGFVQ